MLTTPQFRKFVLVLALQWVATYGVYVLVLRVSWQIAYLCALAVGIAIQTVLQIKTTFKTRLTLGSTLRYIGYQLAYAATYWSLLAITIALGAPKIIAPLVVMAIATPFNFVLTRSIILRKAPFASTRTESRSP